MKKNLFMSLWLSTANRLAGSLRGHASAQVKRRLNAAVTEATRENMKLWSGGVKPVVAKPKRRR